jgi:radical SAM superfamily enzyme YgiQ (UPF0313 family)
MNNYIFSGRNFLKELIMFKQKNSNHHNESDKEQSYWRTVSKPFKNRLLLTSVFGPFGIDDEYGEASNKMELFHNQVTREQGLFSYRFSHNSFGLYFLAENLSIPSTLLDFPSLKDFKKELKNRYEYVAISFIIPNFKKAKKMAELVRELSPGTKIILGGHGANVPDLRNLIEYDYICKGEGIKFMREIFHENPNAPIRHPLVAGSFRKQIMGLPLPLKTGLLVPGIGCANKCRFCATSHFFCDYIAYLPTGQDIFDVCCRFEEEQGVTDFAIMDENFLKMKDRALELLELMEKHNKKFMFTIFSSAETLKKLGELDILVRLGISFIWMGVESKKEVYEKNKGTDFHQLIGDLKKRGISVLASAILFLEHHDKTSIFEDIDFSISLKPDYLQFMQLGPIPGTPLYDDYDKKGLLLKDVPLEQQHGQDKIWFYHEHFTRIDSQKYLKLAFEMDYQQNGASLLRAIETCLNGYEYTLNHKNPLVKARAETFYMQLLDMRHLLYAIQIFKENRATAALLKEIRKKFSNLLDRPDLKTLAFSLMVVLFGIKEKFLINFTKNNKQPKTQIHKYEQRVEAESLFPEITPQTILPQTISSPPQLKKVKLG